MVQAWLTLRPMHRRAGTLHWVFTGNEHNDIPQGGRPPLRGVSMRLAVRAPMIGFAKSAERATAPFVPLSWQTRQPRRAERKLCRYWNSSSAAVALEVTLKEACANDEERKLVKHKLASRDIRDAQSLRVLCQGEHEVFDSLQEACPARLHGTSGRSWRRRQSQSC